MEATMFEAKTKLSELVKRAQQGEEVILTSGRKRTPVARIEPVCEDARKPCRLGVLFNPDFKLPESFWDEVSDEEAGYADDGIL